MRTQRTRLASAHDRRVPLETVCLERIALEVTLGFPSSLSIKGIWAMLCVQRWLWPTEIILKEGFVSLTFPVHKKSMISCRISFFHVIYFFSLTFRCTFECVEITLLMILLKSIERPSNLPLIMIKFDKFTLKLIRYL